MLRQYLQYALWYCFVGMVQDFEACLQHAVCVVDFYLGYAEAIPSVCFMAVFCRNGSRF